MNIDRFHRSYFLIVLIFVTLGVWMAQEMQNDGPSARPEFSAPLPKQPFQV